MTEFLTLSHAVAVALGGVVTYVVPKIYSFLITERNKLKAELDALKAAHAQTQTPTPTA